MGMLKSVAISVEYLLGMAAVPVAMQGAQKSTGKELVLHTKETRNSENNSNFRFEKISI